MRIIIPMAGRGSRLFEESLTPKPFVKINGHPLLAWAVTGLPLYLAHSIIFIFTKEDKLENYLEKFCSRYLPKDLNYETVVLQERTSGQAESVYLGCLELDTREPLLIFNCDTFVSNDFPESYAEFDGLLGVHISNDPSLSYVEVDNDIVIKTAEKERISNKASTGLYYFSSKQEFDQAFLNTHHVNESFVAPLFNYLIKGGKKIGTFETSIFIPLGTPKELTAFRRNPEMR